MDHLTEEAVVVIRHLAVEGEVLALLVLLVRLRLKCRVSEGGRDPTGPGLDRTAYLVSRNVLQLTR